MLLGYSFEPRLIAVCWVLQASVMTNSFLLTFERQLDKVKTRLTTLYVVQKLIITATIIDQLKLCKLQ